MYLITFLTINLLKESMHENGSNKVECQLMAMSTTVTTFQELHWESHRTLQIAWCTVPVALFKSSFDSVCCSYTMMHCMYSVYKK